MVEYKVCDEIRVFEVLEKGQKYWSECENIKGMHVAEIYPNRPNERCPDVFIHNGCDFINLGVGNQCKHIATMRITKLKQKEDKK